MRKFLTAAFLAALASVAGGFAPSHASVVVAEVSGATGGADTTGSYAVSFTTTSAFTDVTISVLLYSSSGDTGSATVYLTDSIGPGTTESANEIAQVSVTDLPVIFSTDTPEAVFSGLTLPAGTYYVIAASDAGSPGAYWGEPASPVYTTAMGVTINSDQRTSTLDASYSPASPFTTGGGASEQDYAFSVTGSPVPEPSTWAMMLIGFAALGYAGFRSTSARHSTAA